MSLAKQHLEPLIEKTLQEMHSRIVEIAHETGNREQIAEAICNYAGSYLSAESKSLMSSLYKVLSEETLGKEPFVTARNRNKFYEKDIWAMIFDRYSFEAPGKINYAQVDEKLAALPVPLATAGLGVVLSIALSKVIIIPIALVVAGGLYYFLRENKKTLNTDNFVSAIDVYLERIKRELLEWLENIEDFYHQQVAEVIKTLESNA
jgi:hypothetical protein